MHLFDSAFESQVLLDMFFWFELSKHADDKASCLFNAFFARYFQMYFPSVLCFICHQMSNKPDSYHKQYFLRTYDSFTCPSVIIFVPICTVHVPISQNPKLPPIRCYELQFFLLNKWFLLGILRYIYSRWDLFNSLSLLCEVTSKHFLWINGFHFKTLVGRCVSVSKFLSE